MKYILNAISNFFEVMSPTYQEYKYLSESRDIVDLERRQKEIMRGTAPYQIKRYY